MKPASACPEAETQKPWASVVIRRRWKLIAVVLLLLVGAIVMKSMSQPRAEVEFSIVNDAIVMTGHVRGKDAYLRLVTVVDSATGKELWKYYDYSDTDSFRITMGMAGDRQPDSGSGDVTPAEFLRYGKLTVTFHGFYVPWSPPAVSGWDSTYEVSLVGDCVTVLSREDRF